MEAAAPGLGAGPGCAGVGGGGGRRPARSLPARRGLCLAPESGVARVALRGPGWPGFRERAAAPRDPEWPWRAPSLPETSPGTSPGTRGARSEDAAGPSPAGTACAIGARRPARSCGSRAQPPG